MHHTIGLLRGFRSALALVLILLALLAHAATPVPVDKQVQVSYTGLVLNRTTNTFDTVATIKNIGAAPVFAPMSLVVTGISVGTVQLANPTGTTSTGLPYVSVSLSGGSLNPGASVTPTVLKFSNPTRVGFTFTQSVSGVLASSNHPPTANAGADQTVDAGATVSLDGTQSTDIDGDRLTYRWSLASVPTGSHASLANATSVNPSFVADVAGAYTAQLIVNDGVSDSAAAMVVISTINSRPVANAGRDQLVASGAVVRLNGSNSTDVDGDRLTYHWTLSARPAGSGAALDSATSVNPSFVADKPGSYQAQLIVNDGHADSAPSMVTISTQSVAPVADAGPDQAVSVSAHVQLDGSKSAAANGGPLAYRWSLITLPAGSTAALNAPTTVNPTFTVDRAGVYTAQLIVNDGHADSAPNIVVISTGNVRPVADAGPAQNAHVGDAVVLDGTASHDANGDALSFSWALLFRPANSTATLTSATQSKAGLACDVPGTFVAQLIVSDDELDSVPATTTVTVTVAPVNHDPQITSTPVTSGQVGVAYRYQVVATDQDGDPLSYGLSVSPANMSISGSGLVTWTPGSSGTFGVTVRVTDGRGGSKTQAFNINVSGNGLPPDPSTVAPKLDPTVANSFFASTGFLYTGANPIQTGVAPGTIDLTRSSVLRGKVADSTGAPLTGVNVSIVGHPEFGQTLSRLDGMFDMAANGGGRLTVHYSKAGFLPAQRQVQTNWQEFTIVPDVVLLPRDARVTTINFGAGLPSMQVARGSVQNDADGQRQATVLFPAGTTAALVQPNGSMLPADTLNVRFTEYTVGPNGPKAMPGDLPPTSTYTYAVELGADESVAKVNGRDVVFNQPIVYYVENFMKVPVGQIVPVGFYDPAQSTWIGAPNGRVIKILSITGGMANVDVDGDGVADTGAALVALGITNAERQQLAALYPAGTSLWRTPMDHFSTFDQNWSFVCIPSDCGPPDEDPSPEPLSCQDEGPGSIIGCERQTLGEDIAIVGTPFTLHYESDRTPGRTAEQGLQLSLASNGLPNGVKAIQVEILVAGQKLTQTIPTSTGTTSFAWDGNDAYGRPLNGSFPVTTRIGYTYDIVASAAITVPSSWARFSGIPLSVNGWRTQITLYQEHTTQITRQDQRGLGLGGWSLSVMHSYDPSGHVLNLGDGRRRDVDQLTGNVVSTIAGDGTATFGGEGVSALKSGLSTPAGIAVGPDRSVYIVDGTNHRIIRVDPNGIQTTVAGTGTRGFSGDGGPANQAQLANPTSVALGLDGSVYISDRSNFRVRRVAPNGIISTLVGTGVQGVPVEGSVAATTPIFPRNVAVGLDGRVFISDAKHIWVVDQNGVINAYAGADVLFGGDGGPALQAGLQSPGGMAFQSDGTLFFVDNNQIRKVTPQGIISTVAGPGPGNGSFSGDGGPALSAGLDAPRDIALGRDGSIYIAATNRVRRVGTNGIINTFAGNGAAAPFADGGPGPQTTIATANGLAAGPDQAIYITDAGHHRIRRVAPAFPGLSASDILVPSDDGEQAYVFSGEGRHLRTVHALTGATLLSFTYDANGYPTAITDGDGNVTTIQRNRAVPTAIVAPFGQRTTVTTTADGWLASVSDPAGQSRSMQYSATGLLQRLVDPRGNAYRFTYDAVGRLIKDEDPAGGSTSLARTEQPNGFTVTTTSALGRTRTFQLEQLSTGANRSTVTEPSGATTVTVTDSGGNEQTTEASGNVVTVQYAPDARWAMLVPLATRTITTPAGLKRTVVSSQSVVLTDPANPLSLKTLTEVVNDNGAIRTSVYDATTRSVTITTQSGRSSKFFLDPQGRVTQEQAPALGAVAFAYNSKGMLASAIAGSATQRTANFVYNASGELSGITDPVGRTMNLAYDSADRLTSQARPDRQVIRYVYDASGNLTTVTTASGSLHGFTYTPINMTATYVPPGIGTTIQYAYDADRAPVMVTFPDGQAVKFFYDTSGRAATLQLSRGQIAYAYDQPTGRLTSITAPGSVGLSYVYDGDLLTGATWSGPVAAAVSYGYDSSFRVITQKINGSNSVGFSYDGDSLLTHAGDLSLSHNSQNGLLTSTTLGAVSESWIYNEFGEATDYRASFSTTLLYSEHYARDLLGRITQKTVTIGGGTTAYSYDYDVLGRLIGVTANGTQTAAYGFDANGNRINATSGNVSVVGVYDVQDRLVSYGGATYAYGGGGELRSRTVANQTTSYTYDPLGNLIAVSLPDGTSIGYLVDGINQRLGKLINGTLVQGFLYQDGLHPIAELDGTNNVVSRFVYADRENTPSYMIKGGKTYKIVSDQVGSPRLVIDVGSGSVVQRIDYDEFGNVVADTNPGFQPFGFAGGLYDLHTKLVRFGARDYDPRLGRWTSKDSIGIQRGTMNAYLYALADPVNYVDPEGLDGQAAGTIVCKNHKYQVVHILPEDPASGPCSTTRHEKSHIKDFEARYGSASCAADGVQGSLPHFPGADAFTGRGDRSRNSNGVSEDDRFVAFSEANAYSDEIKCLKKLRNCASKNNRKDLDRKIKFAMKQLSENIKFLETNGYPAFQGFGGLGGR